MISLDLFEISFRSFDNKYKGRPQKLSGCENFGSGACWTGAKRGQIYFYSL